GGNGIFFAGYGTGLIHSDSTGRLTSSLVNLNNATDVLGILPVANGGSPFEQMNGAIVERITTQDLLLGSQATSSAKFAVLNMAGGVPVASVSAQNAAGTALVLSSDGSLQTTRMNTLTVGGTSTGNILLDSGSGLISLLDATTIAG